MRCPRVLEGVSRSNTTLVVGGWGLRLTLVTYRSQLSGLFLGEQADEPGREQTAERLLSKGARPPKHSSSNRNIYIYNMSGGGTINLAVSTHE
jgi:hypothetical protein